LRKWKDGDYFFPLGMNNKQKLSDFFINQKINRFEKDELWILEHNNNIVWIVGIRIDNRYKVTSKTNQVLILQINN
jgi:tRNA(Ile)-lysidine synthase